jgi:hypothetical protein
MSRIKKWEMVLAGLQEAPCRGRLGSKEYAQGWLHGRNLTRLVAGIVEEGEISTRQFVGQDADNRRSSAMRSKNA